MIIHQRGPWSNPNIGNDPEWITKQLVKVSLCSGFVQTSRMIIAAIEKSSFLSSFSCLDLTSKMVITNNKEKGGTDAIPRYWILVISILMFISKPRYNAPSHMAQIAAEKHNPIKYQAPLTSVRFNVKRANMNVEIADRKNGDKYNIRISNFVCSRFCY